ncbi:MAG: cobalamin-dependent protein [Candidatus Freyarchaeota archaeon]|nr:cobalamin-dependent protein [Candidatus Jordarchaeia archaeon]MBS7268434.1 cobalamin-dependent protein [Candidatus Jordarchaeia archaeon]MBS7279352.1 cobalamin-dependent protein [Candidatus Jordarchaeia archaeon]
MSEEKIRRDIEEALLEFEEEKLAKILKDSLEKGFSPLKLIDVLTDVLRDFGEKFESGEFFLPQLIAAGDAAQGAIKEVLEPALKKSGESREPIGKVVIGTVFGDIHDIGKNIVASMLFANGFEVYDLGKDVQPEEFAKKAKELNADIVGASAMLTMTMQEQLNVAKALEQYGIRDKVKYIIGGAIVTEKWAEEIGADGFATDAVEAVKLAKELLGVT